MGIERMGKDVPCNIPAFAIMDAWAKWEDLPTDSAQAHMLSLISKEGVEREGKEEGKTASRDRQGMVSSAWSQASGNILLTVGVSCEQ